MSLTRSQSLEAALLANGPIAALVGSRIYPLVALPASGRPLIVYKFRVDYQFIYGAAVLAETQPLEIKSWASDYDQAHALADAVQALLAPQGIAKGFNGLLGGTGGINVIACRLSDDDENRIAIGPDQFVFEIVSNYIMQYLP